MPRRVVPISLAPRPAPSAPSSARGAGGGEDVCGGGKLEALETMAMASAESSPGHLLLSARVLAFGGPIEPGDQLSIAAPAPPPEKNRRLKKEKGARHGPA